MAVRSDIAPGRPETPRAPHGHGVAATVRGRTGRSSVGPRGARWATARTRFAPPLAVATVLVLALILSSGFRAEVQRAAIILGHGDAAALRDYLRSYGAWAPVASLLLMVAQAVAAPVPASLLVFANGLAFGVLWGTLFSLAGQLLAAAVCFWLARTLGRGPTGALLGRLGLAAADRWLARWGAVGILAARLVPGVAFDAVSYAAGLTQIGFGRFAVATVVGVAPQTLAYAYLGERVPGAVWLPLVPTVLVAVGVALATLVRHRRRHAPRRLNGERTPGLLPSTTPDRDPGAGRRSRPVGAPEPTEGA